jgi:hypothetical protein
MRAIYAMARLPATAARPAPDIKIPRTFALSHDLQDVPLRNAGAAMAFAVQM